MTRPIHKLLLAGALTLALSGCATGYTVFEEDHKNLVYSGTRQDLNGWVFIHGGILDLPFSFIADTILLPYTIPRTIWNYATGRKGADDRWDEDDEEPEDGVEGEAGS